MAAWFLLSAALALSGDGPQVAWEGECGDAAALMTSVRDFMRADLPEEVAREVSVEAVVERRGSSHTVKVRVATPLGESQRQLEAQTCEQAVNGAAIVVAVALDPLTVVEALQADPPADPVPEPDPEPESARLSSGTSVYGVFDYGSLDAVSGGAALAFFFGVGRLRIEARGTYLAPAVSRPFEGSDAGASVQLGTGSVRACFAPTVRRLELPNCAWVEAGAARGQGVDVPMARTRHDPWVAVGIGTGLSWWVRPHFGLGLHADGVAVLYRPRFVIDGLGTAYQAGLGALRVAGGPQVRF